jgi:hypothetical protein
LQEAKHRVIHGKQVRIEYREYAGESGEIMVHYSVLVDGRLYPLKLEIPKAVLQFIHKNFDHNIYRNIADSFFERIAELTATFSTRVEEARIVPSGVFHEPTG